MSCFTGMARPHSCCLQAFAMPKGSFPVLTYPCLVRVLAINSCRVQDWLRTRFGCSGALGCETVVSMSINIYRLSSFGIDLSWGCVEAMKPATEEGSDVCFSLEWDPVGSEDT